MKQKVELNAVAACLHSKALRVLRKEMSLKKNSDSEGEGWTMPKNPVAFCSGVSYCECGVEEGVRCKLWTEWK